MNRRIVALVLTAALCGLAGCGGDHSEEGPTMNTPAVDVAARPPLPEMLVSYEKLLDELQAAVDGATGPRGWRNGDEASNALCPDGGPTARQGTTAARIGTAVPDAQWAAAVTAITQVLNSHDFGKPIILLDQPNDHSFDVVDSYGGRVLVANRTALTLGVITGCHRPS